MTTLLIVVVVAVLLIGVALLYNRLIADRNKVADGWAGIDVQLTRRADLVPNLVATVEGARVHERQVTEAVTAARSALVAADGPAANGAADDVLEGALHQLYAVAEGYPDLKTSENFLALQRELATLEEDISFARRYYNATVERFNTRQQSFPALLIARPLGFGPAEYFKADADARTVPTAEFGS